VPSALSKPNTYLFSLLLLVLALALLETSYEMAWPTEDSSEDNDYLPIGLTSARVTIPAGVRLPAAMPRELLVPR